MADFWGAQFSSGQSKEVCLREKYLCLTEVSLGKKEREEQREPVYVYVTVDGERVEVLKLNPGVKKLHLNGVYFDRNISISHTLSRGKVYMTGYQTSEFKPFGKKEERPHIECDHACKLCNRNGNKSKGRKLKMALLSIAIVASVTAVILFAGMDAQQNQMMLKAEDLSDNGEGGYYYHGAK